MEIFEGLRASRACAICMGLAGLSPWVHEELGVALDRATKDRSFRLFLVLLPGASVPEDPELGFLLLRRWIDLRSGLDDPESLRHLVAAIRGIPQSRTVPGEPDRWPGRALPEGTVTFCFSDIEGSTRLLERLGPAYANLLQAHHDLIRAAASAHGGVEVDTQGDAFFVAFPRATEAVTAALSAQLALAAHPWPEGTEVRVRMGLHSADARLAPTGYVGLGVHKAARICSAAHGGQVLLSEVTRSLLGDDLPPEARLLDLGAHRLKDLAQPERLFQLTHQQLPESFPPLHTLDAHPHNLPVQLTSFVGREAQLAMVWGLLEGSRLVTLLGAGGAGKTRLALQLAGELVGRFEDGAWVVELAPLADPDLLPQQVASALGVREEPGRALLATLTAHLADRELLLVLDNCEHLVGAAAFLAAHLLRGAPRLHILATSREALGVAGETTWRVPSLSTPDPTHPGPPEALADFEAVRLFVERAQAARPEFSLTPGTAPAVARICTRLDGIPLALELAAARVRALPPAEIASRLDNRFRLLTGGSRDALPRQQTLRAALDWSHELLSDAERACFRRLGVFAGSFSLEAAEAICPGGPVEDVESSTSSPTSSTSPSSSPRRTQGPPGTGCSRRFGNTRGKSSRARGRRREPEGATLSGSPPWPRRLSRSSRALSRRAGSGVSRPTTTTCWPPSAGPPRSAVAVVVLS